MLRNFSGKKCSSQIINHDRIWYEPWRFLTYGFVHNTFDHLFINCFSQLFFGLPLEFSHASWRVAFIYFSGIVFGGFGREIFKNATNPLVGASGTNYGYFTNKNNCNISKIDLFLDKDYNI